MFIEGYVELSNDSFI